MTTCSNVSDIPPELAQTAIHNSGQTTAKLRIRCEDLCFPCSSSDGSTVATVVVSKTSSCVFRQRQGVFPLLPQAALQLNSRAQLSTTQEETSNNPAHDATTSWRAWTQKLSWEQRLNSNRLKRLEVSVLDCVVGCPTEKWSHKSQESCSPLERHFRCFCVDAHAEIGMSC